MGTVDLVRELQKFERFAIALFFSDCLGLVTYQRKLSSFPASMPAPLVIARLALSNLKLNLVDPDYDRRLLLEHHQTSGQPLVLT